MDQITKLKNRLEILESDHIQDVIASFISTNAEGQDVYRVATPHNGNQLPLHKYRVKVYGSQFTCNCPSKWVCRHIIRVALNRSGIYSTGFDWNLLDNYKGHKKGK